eukprot:4070029-Prymnesium_polylepis.1
MRLAWLVFHAATALAETAARTACSSQLTGDLKYEACASFCLESSASRHCAVSYTHLTLPTICSV